MIERHMKTNVIATRKQCKVILLLLKRLPVMNPQPPEIVNFVDGLRVQRTLKSPQV